MAQLNQHYRTKVAGCNMVAALKNKVATAETPINTNIYTYSCNLNRNIVIKDRGIYAHTHIYIYTHTRIYFLSQPLTKKCM